MGVVIRRQQRQQAVSAELKGAAPNGGSEEAGVRSAVYEGWAASGKRLNLEAPVTRAEPDLTWSK